MAEVFPRDLWLRVGARTLLRYGTAVRRTRPADRGGEQLKESFARADGGLFATYIDQAGTLRTAAAGKLRLHWNDAASPVLLLEPTSTQQFTFARQLDNAAWTKNGATITANASSAPDGTATADKIVESALNERHFIVRGTPAVTDSTLQSWSFFAKAAERNWVRIRTVDKRGEPTGVRSTWFNLTTGLFGTKDAGHNLRASRRLADGSFRLMCSFDSNVGANTPQVFCELAAADAGSAYAGDGASGIYAWGLQFESNAPFPTSFIYSDAASNRAQDILTVPWGYGIGPIAVLTKMTEAGNQLLSLGQPRVWWIGKTDFAITPFLGLMNNGGYSTRWNPGTGLSASVAANPALPGDLVQQLSTLDATGVIQGTTSVNGLVVVGAAQAATGPLPPKYSDTVLSILLTGWTVELEDLVIARSVRALTEMQAVPA